MRVTSSTRALARAVTPRSARHWIRRRTGTPQWNVHADYRPPQWPPAGFRAAAPDFVGVGAQRSGSTWWFASICLHPDVYQHPELAKENRYLLRFHDHAPDASEIAEYAAWFPRPRSSPAEVISGEWTPSYMSFPWIGPVITTVAPGAKVIASLRDPVERFVSGLALQRSQGRANEVATLRQINFGFYAHQVAALRATVPEVDLLVLQYEQCRDDPVGQLDRTFAFLGLAPFDVPESQLRLPGGGVFTDKPEVSADRRARLVDAYAPDVEQLLGMLPSFDRSLWANFR
jgi:hypothetical protein